jgi:hypothetical protein
LEASPLKGEEISQIINKYERREMMAKPTDIPKPDLDIASLCDQAYQECLAMTKYALASGKKIPAGTMEALQGIGSHPKSQQLSSLVQIHEKLARAIAPATPQTILILESESAKKHFFSFLGLLPLVRRFMLTAVIFLILFIGVQTFPQADLSLPVLDQQNDVFILLVLSLIAAAGLGATFAALFQANKYITAGTYDPKYESSYWIRFILGIISGLTLSILIPTTWYKNAQPGFMQMAKPLLAMLGGFSTTVVYRILSRLVESVESLIVGNKEEAFAVKEKEINAKIAEEDFRTRQEMATSLMNVLQQIDPNVDPEQIRQQLNSLLKKVSPTSDLGELGSDQDEAAATNEDSTPAEKKPQDKPKDDRDESV